MLALGIIAPHLTKDSGATIPFSLIDLLQDSWPGNALIRNVVELFGVLVNQSAKSSLAS